MNSLFWRCKQDIEIYNLQIEKILREANYVEEVASQLHELCNKVADLEKHTRPIELMIEEKQKRKGEK